MQNRDAVGYVVEVDSGKVLLNLLDHHRGQLASHGQGISPVAEIGSMLAINAGYRLLIMKIIGLNFAEPKEVHKLNDKSKSLDREPLRHIQGVTVGWIEQNNGERRFLSDTLVSPPLGAEAFPVSDEEMKIILGGNEYEGPVNLGNEYQTSSKIQVGLNSLLAQHVAVVGSSGQGKSSFTASILQQLADMPKARIVVFDINGEYDRAFKLSEEAIQAGNTGNRLNDKEYKHTAIGESVDGSESLKIPYYALGRQGLHRLCLPSEKTQRPALTFAINNLKYVNWDEVQEGASLYDDETVLFSDCRQEGANDAYGAIKKLREGDVEPVQEWPHMSTLAALVAESHALVPGRYGIERNAFYYSNVSPLITRIHRLIDDEMFNSVVDVNGGPAKSDGGELNWQTEADCLVNEIFGDFNSDWKVHVVNLRQIPQDLMPMVLGSLLELYASVLFRRGQSKSPATLLVLEEAHHYLRPIGEESETEKNALAYERLAKEGRKFGLSLWLSTQRPKEVSPTVLSQCGTWFSFRLTSDQDLKAVSTASEWADTREVKRIAGLSRQHALAIGNCISIPTFFKAANANPTPKSEDAPFDDWVSHHEETEES